MHMPQYEKGVDIFSQDRHVFKKHFANLASDLVKKVPHPTGNFGNTFSAPVLQGN